MQNTTKIILAIAMAAAGLGYFQVVSANDAVGSAQSASSMERAASRMLDVSQNARSPLIAAARR